MKSKKSFKEKLPLLFSTCISLFGVFTASVSTFAWFQATSNAKIRATASSTSINVNAPDDFDIGDPIFYKYNNNSYVDTVLNGSSISTPTNFTEVSKADPCFSLSGLVPGKRMTFGIKVTDESSRTINNAVLKMTTYATANTKPNRVVLDNSGNEVVQDSSVNRYVRIEEAIRIYGGINTTGSFSEGPNCFTYEYGVTTTTTEFTLAEASSLNSSTIYLFYTIEFSADAGTLYGEYEYDDFSYSEVDEANSDASTRYFSHGATLKNSNAYEGMSFQITDLELTVW